MTAFLALPTWLLVLLPLCCLFNFWGIWHAFSHHFPVAEERLIWMALCVVVPLLGPLIYLLVGLRRSRKNFISQKTES